MTPAFAVVGHPNKGKSSIVATLARDDAVAISAQSGTTQVAEAIEVRVGELSYSLIDTPGFQRPAKVMQWLQQQASSAELRQGAVKKFIADAECQRDFPDEVRLLTPIVEGAAILYVVDGSRPYSADYEAEMEVLRWTGQPSMALINPIENESHVQSWEQALSQYFKVVKVFNAMQADFDKQLTILEAFSHLREGWQAAITPIIFAYRNQREGQQEESLKLLVKLLEQLCNHQLSQQVLSRAQAKLMQDVLQQQYFTEMKKIEAAAHEGLKQIYRYRNLESEIYELPFEDNLFDTEKWIVWGLNRHQITAAAAMAGAAAGAVIDASLAGHTFLMGALAGSALGAGGAWFGADRIAEFKIKGLPVGGYEARQGPVKNHNFPYVVLGRFLFLEKALRNRNHARRDVLQINKGDLSVLLDSLTGSQQKELHKACARLRQQKPVIDLAEQLRPLLFGDSA